MNEYEQLFHSLFVPDSLGGWEVKEGVGLRPPYEGPEWEAYLHASTNAHKARDKATNRWAWAIPNQQAIEAIAALSPIVEIGCGTGFWAYLLRQAGADVQAFDTRVIGRWYRGRGYGPLQRVHFPVARGNVWKALRMYPHRTLLMVWPPYGESEVDALALRLTKAQHVVVVGERGGCTGSRQGEHLLGWEPWVDEDDHQAWQDEKPLFREIQTIDIPQWPGMHDYVAIFERV